MKNTRDMQLSELVRQVQMAAGECHLLFEYEYDGWVLPKDSMRFLIALVRAIQPKKVVEFGGGLSTRALARELLADSSLLSFDHGQAFANRTQEAVDSSQHCCSIDIMVRQLRVQWYQRKPLTFYDLSSDDQAKLQGAEFVFVDGPPGRLGREAALYVAFSLMSPGAVLMLDDANRPGERRAKAAWKKLFGTAVELEHITNIGKGALVVRKIRDFPCGEPFSLTDVTYAALLTLRAQWRNRNDAALIDA